MLEFSSWDLDSKKYIESELLLYSSKSTDLHLHARRLLQGSHGGDSPNDVWMTLITDRPSTLSSSFKANNSPSVCFIHARRAQPGGVRQNKRQIKKMSYLSAIKEMSKIMIWLSGVQAFQFWWIILFMLISSVLSWCRSCRLITREGEVNVTSLINKDLYTTASVLWAFSL